MYDVIILVGAGVDFEANDLLPYVREYYPELAINNYVNKSALPIYDYKHFDLLPENQFSTVILIGAASLPDGWEPTVTILASQDPVGSVRELIEAAFQQVEGTDDL